MEERKSNLKKKACLLRRQSGVSLQNLSANMAPVPTMKPMLGKPGVGIIYKFMFPIFRDLSPLFFRFIFFFDHAFLFFRKRAHLSQFILLDSVDFKTNNSHCLLCMKRMHFDKVRKAIETGYRLITFENPRIFTRNYKKNNRFRWTGYSGVRQG